MSTDFKLPELGENITAGDVVRVLVKPGDTIAKDQAVLELETDKATIEVPSSVAGTVTDVRIKEGERIKVGQVVLTLDGEAGAKNNGEAGAKNNGEAGAKNNGEAGAKNNGEAGAKNDGEAGAAEEGGLSQQAPGKQESRGDSPARKPSTDEEATEDADQPEAQQADAAKAAKPKRGEVVDISRGARPAPAPSQVTSTSEPPGPRSDDRRDGGYREGDDSAGPAPPAAPSVRRRARELGVDIRRVAGTGPDGRINDADVQAFVRDALTGSGGAGAPPLPDFTRWGAVERKPMSNIRRKTAEHLTHAWTAIPHVTQHDKADITEIDALRKHYGPQSEQVGGKMTMTAIALKIVAGALTRFPQFNASADMARQEIVYKKSIHVGVAVDTPRGLLVPVIRDVDRKGLFELSAELAVASGKARGGKLSLDEMQGGGFTITNLGGIGGTAFTPIVNWPEVAILGISRGSYEPVWRPERGAQSAGSDADAQSFQPRLMLPLSLSYDHRVIDGADAARFLRWLADAFEQPFVLAL